MDTLTNLLLLLSFLLALYMGLALLCTLLDWLEPWTVSAKQLIFAWVGGNFGPRPPRRKPETRREASVAQRLPPLPGGRNNPRRPRPRKPPTLALLQRSLPLATPALPQDPRVGFDNGWQRP